MFKYLLTGFLTITTLGTTPFVGKLAQNTSTKVTITATVSGSQTPPTATRPEKVINNNFEISGNNERAPIVGDGLDERTWWTFDFTHNPDISAFKRAESITSATLTIELNPRLGVNSDTVGIEGLRYVISPKIKNLPLDKVSKITINLLDTYSSEEILGALQKGEFGNFRMYYDDDAIVSFASLKLTGKVLPEDLRLKTLRADTTGTYGEYGVIPALNDVQATFKRASGSGGIRKNKRHDFSFIPKEFSINEEKPDDFYFNPFTEKRDHIQSVARIAGEENENLLALSRNARDIGDAAIYVARFDGIQSDGDAWKWASSRTSDNSSDYFYHRIPEVNHAGGIQALGSMLFVAADCDSGKKCNALIQVMDLRNPSDLSKNTQDRLVNQLVIDNSRGELNYSVSGKQITSRAAAVAAVRLQGDKHLLFVRRGSKDDESGWFFISDSTDGTNEKPKWHLLDFWHEDDLPDGTEWHEWETINFIPEAETGDIYMVAMGTLKNKSVLYRLTEIVDPITGHRDFSFEYVNGRGLNTSGIINALNLSTRYGAGIHITPNRSIVSYVTSATPKIKGISEFRYHK